MDKLIDAVCTICRKHERSGFVEGTKVDIRSSEELQMSWNIRAGESGSYSFFSSPADSSSACT